MKFKSENKRKMIIFAIIAIVLVAICAIFASSKVSTLNTRNLDAETLRAITYGEFSDDDVKTDSDNVEFLSFFLRDLDGDGVAEKVKGTCKHVDTTDRLYTEINVKTEGYLKDGYISINGQNFYLKTSLLADEIIKGDYLGTTTGIVLQDKVYAGSQKLFEGIVYDSIGNDTNNYSKVNSITLTGTYVDDEGVETPIKKTIDLTVDWYGNVSNSLSTYSQSYNLPEVATEEEVAFEFHIINQETTNDLLLKENVVTATIPELKGYKPTRVEVTDSNVNYEYNQETGIITITRSSTINENGYITQTLSRYNQYNVVIYYPKEVYDEEQEDTIVLQIPVTAYYTAYNNPNSEFSNPLSSEVKKGIISLTYSNTQGDMYNFHAYIGKYTYDEWARKYKYIMSKKAPTKLYQGIYEEGVEDLYTVKWYFFLNDYDIVTTAIMKETESNYSDQFQDNDGNFYPMTDFSSNIGIAFSGATSTLGEDGYINVYNDETNELMHTFTSEEWDKYTESSPYKYDEPIKHIRVETSKVNPNSSFYVYNVKQIDDQKLVSTFTQEQFDEFAKVATYLTGGIKLEGDDETIHSVDRIAYADYKDEISVAELNIYPKEIPVTENEKTAYMSIKTSAEYYNQAQWKNGEFLVKLPPQIISAEIKEISVSNSNVEILGYELYKQGENYFIKILTTNETPATYFINIKMAYYVDITSVTSTEYPRLYSHNEESDTYQIGAVDTYDVNGNNDKQEVVGTDTDWMSFIAPSTLVTNQVAKNYDNEGNITVSPNIAEVKKTQRTFNIDLNLINNYSSTISDIDVIGELPFEGNTYIISGKDLGSGFTTQITEPGIIVPEALKDKVTVYYSTNPTATKDLENVDNLWTTTPEDWTQIKRYLIDFGDSTIPGKTSYTFTYEAYIPEGVHFNEHSYSAHAIYFALDTAEGKLYTQTEPAKLGIKVIEKYNIEIEKYKTGTTLVVPGATYSIKEYDENGTYVKERLVNSDENGKIAASGFYADRTYVLKELKSPENYVLNDDEIEFKVSENDQGELEIVITSEDTFANTPVMELNAEGIYVLKAKVEDEPKYDIILTKTDEASGEKLANVVYEFTDESEKTSYITNSDGQLNIKGLVLGNTYQLKETKADDYYVYGDIIEFTVQRNDQGVLEIITDDEEMQNAVIVDNELEDTAKVSVTFTNEKIPTYSLQLLKVAKDDDTNTGLEGAIYRLTSIDTGKTSAHKTDENGILTIDNLYQYVDGKYITGKYTIEEINPPDGYSLNGEKITFSSEIVAGELIVTIENQGDLETFKQVSVDGNTVKLILEDKPLFKLIKVDEFGNRLAGVKFVIHQVTPTHSVIDYAKDVNGNYIGEKVEDGKYKYVIETDENGEITLALSGGHYRIIEIETGEEYYLSESELDRTNYFKIEGSTEIYYIEDLIDFANEVNNGKTYTNETVNLLRNLDFDSDDSYRQPDDTSYGDYNGDGTVQGIKDELTSVSRNGFKGIGTSENKFKGTFAGNRHTISNYQSNTGLFNYIDGAKLEAFALLTVDVGDESCGALVNYADNSEILACYVTGEMSSAEKLSGMVLYANNTKFQYAHSEVEISDASYAGGILYEGDSCNINYSYNEGTINVTGYAGGIATTYKNGTMYNVQNISTLTATHTGGIVASALNSTFDTCENSGQLNYRGYAGGIVAEVLEGNTVTITRVNNSGNIGSGSGAAGGIAGYVRAPITIKTANNSGNITISAGEAGGIVGMCTSNSRGTIEYCTNAGNITYTGTGSARIAGIIGTSYQDLNYCINIGDITGQATSFAAGIMAMGNSNEIINCTNGGDVVVNNATSSTYAAGIVCLGYSKLYNSCNIGNVTASAGYVGGLVSVLYGTINNVYNAGTVSNGGTLGYAYGSPNISNAYYLEGTADAELISGPSNVTLAQSKTDSEMRGSAGLITVLNQNAQTISSSYSRLSWNLGTGWQYGTYTFDGLPFPASGFETVTSNKVEITHTAADTVLGDNATEITINNTMKRFNITTEIAENSKFERAGGTITGIYNDTYPEDENIQFVEEVIYGNDSIVPIQIVPDENYIITKITINGEEINFVADENGQVTLPVFASVVEDKHVTVTFEKDMSRVIVHHYLKDENGVYTTNKVAEDETYTGPIDDAYVTAPHVDLEKLQLEKDDEGNYVIPANAKGTYTAEVQEVIYYYEALPVNLTVHHYLNGTEDKLAEDENYEYPSIVTFDENGNYTVSGNGKFDVSESTNYKTLLDKYVLVQITSTNAETVTIEDELDITEETEVTFYYELKEFKITTEVKEHTELRTNEYTNEKEEVQVKGGTISGEGKNPYEIVEYGKNSVNELVVTPDNEYKVKIITLVSIDEQGNETSTIIYGYGKDESAEITYSEDENGIVTLSNFENVTENKNIIVEFEAVLGTVVVHHYVQGTGEEFGIEAVTVPMKDGSVAENEIKQDYIGEPYATKQKENINDLYKLVSTSGETSGKYINGTIDVYYYYDYKDYEYTVEYYYENNETQEFDLAEDKTETYQAKYGTEITTYDEKLVDGYIFDKTENLPLTITEVVENNVIKVYYALIDCKYTVEYYYENKQTHTYEIDSEATVEASAEFKDIIVNYIDKCKTGYVLSKEENLPLTISTDESKNVIKVYYDLQDYNYTVNYFYDNEKDETLTENKTAEYLDVISTYTDNLKDGYVLVEEENLPLTISEKAEDNIINIYYETAYEISTSVVEHTENYKDGSSKTVTGGSISGMGNEYYEQVTKGKDNKKEIQITPEAGYEIVNVKINGTNYELSDSDKDSLTLPAGYFTNVQEDIHVEVEFRKTSNVIVKYLEKDTEAELHTQETIAGYEGKPFETSRKPVLYYEAAAELPISDENKVAVSGNGTMYADTLTIIYWYEKVESGVIVRHIEIDEKGNETEISAQTVSGYMGDTVTTQRNTYEGYVPVNGPEQDNEDITVALGSENSKSIQLLEDGIKEVWYYYEKQFKITTETKPFTETVDGVETQVKVGTISGEDEAVYEYVLNRGANSKQITIVPNEKYKVKQITVNGNVVEIEENEDHTVVIPAKYFADVQEDLHIVAEFEKIPAKVIVKYVYKHTGEEIKPEQIITGIIDDEYSVSREDIENYLPLLPDPSNLTGTMTEEDIEVIFYYTKQLEITTDVIEYEEKEQQTIKLPKEETENPVLNKVKGGSISGEDETPYELLYAGDNSSKDIEIVPENGYQIVMIRINGQEQDLSTLEKQNGSIKLPGFENVDEDKHIEVRFAKIPVKIAVKYLDKQTNELVASEERATGNMFDNYEVHAKEVNGYELIESPEKESGILESDLVLVYYYQKIEPQEPEEEPEQQPEQEPEKDPEEEPEQQPEEEPEKDPEEEPEQQPEQEPEEKPEETPEKDPVEIPESKPEEDTSEVPETKPEVEEENNNTTDNEQTTGSVQTADNIHIVIITLIIAIILLIIPIKKKSKKE